MPRRWPGKRWCRAANSWSKSKLYCPPVPAAPAVSVPNSRGAPAWALSDANSGRIGMLLIFWGTEEEEEEEEEEESASDDDAEEDEDEGEELLLWFLSASRAPPSCCFCSSPGELSSPVLLTLSRSSSPAESRASPCAIWRTGRSCSCCIMRRAWARAWLRKSALLWRWRKLADEEVDGEEGDDTDEEGDDTILEDEDAAMGDKDERDAGVKTDKEIPDKIIWTPWCQDKNQTRTENEEESKNFIRIRQRIVLRTWANHHDRSKRQQEPTRGKQLEKKQKAERSPRPVCNEFTRTREDDERRRGGRRRWEAAGGGGRWQEQEEAN